MQETPVLFLGQEDPLEKGMAIHFTILAWRIPWTEEPGGLQSMRSKRVSHELVTKPKSIEMITTSMMKCAKNSFSLTCLSFMCSFGDIFQQLRERKTVVFKESGRCFQPLST